MRKPLPPLWARDALTVQARPSLGARFRDGLALLLSCAVVAALLVLARSYWPARGALLVGIGLIVALGTLLVWRGLRSLVHATVAPFGGRLLSAMDEAHHALSTANTVTEVARVVLQAARQATGQNDAQPALYLFDPQVRFHIDAAGQAHAGSEALHPEIERALREAPQGVLVRAALEAQMVRAPAQRPLAQALCDAGALCVLPLSLQADLEGALVVPRAARRQRLTAEELGALGDLARHAAGFLSVLGESARAQARVTAALVRAQQAEQIAARAQQAHAELSTELATLRVGGSLERLHQPHFSYGPEMRAFLARLTAQAREATPLWLIAERGIDVAPFTRLVHAEGARAGEALVFGDCADIAVHDGSAALFGRREPSVIGFMQLAANGTLLLRDVPALHLDDQATLAQALTDKSAQPIDVEQRYVTRPRLLVSSQRDPDVMLADGALHAVLRASFPVTLRVPPLRERPGDLPTLLLDALGRAARVLGRPPLGLDPAAQRALLAYDWPGNQEELHTVVQRAALRAKGPRVTLADLRALGHADLAARDELDGAFDVVERRVLERALERAGGNKSEAARLLGLKRSTFFDKLGRHGLGGSEEGEQVSS